MLIKFLCYILFACLIATKLTGEEDRLKTPLSTLNESEVIYFQKFVEGNNRFGFDLYRQSRQQPGSFYMSSYSIAVGLGMVEIGAREKTEQEFQKVFRYSPPLLLFAGDLNASLEKSNSNNGTQVLIPNALWLDKSISILPSFKQTLLRNFRFNLESVDFVQSITQSVQKINQWTFKQTKGKINHIISPQDLSVDMRMVLTTGAYLKGEWALPFDQKQTKRLSFQISKQRPILTEMMQNTAQYFLAKGAQEDVLVIPLRENEEAQIAMVVFLPQTGTALSELEKKFTWENWLQWKSQLKKQWVALTLPSFRIDRRIDLEIILKAMGLHSIFSTESDFSGISSQKKLFLNQFFHKASISLNEKGINSGESFGMKIENPPLTTNETPYPFNADHPFIFMIWDQKTDSILFIGRLS